MHGETRAAATESARIGARRHALALLWFLLVALVPLGAGPFAGRVPWFSDIANVGHPLRAFAHAALARGEAPLWDPHTACGLSHFGDVQSGAGYPPAWLFDRLDPGVAVSVELAFHLFVAGALVYALALVRGCRFAGAVVAGTAFALCGSVLVVAQSPAVLRAAAFVPAAVLGAALLAAGRLRAGFVVAAVGWALELVAGHPQFAAFSLVPMAAVAWGAPGVGGRARLRTAALLGCALAAGALLAAAVLVPCAEYAATSQRALGLAPQVLDRERMEVGEIANFVFFRADRTAGLSDGANTGVLVLALAATGVVALGRGSVALVAAIVVGLLAALGSATPVGALFQALPGFSLFQYACRHVLGAQLLVALLAGHGADAWLAGATSKRTRVVVVAALGAAVVAAAIGPMATKEAARLGVAAVVLALFVAAPRARWAAAALAVAVLGELAFDEGREYSKPEHVATPAEIRREPAALAAVPDDARDGRGFRVITHDRPRSQHPRTLPFGIDNARGHWALTPLRFLHVLAAIDTGRPFPAEPIAAPLYHPTVARMDTPLLDVLCVKYAVHWPSSPGPEWTSVGDGAWRRDCRLRTIDFVPRAVAVESIAAAAAALHAPGFDPTRTVVVETTDVGPASDVGDAARAAALLSSRVGAEGFAATFDAPAAGWALFSWNFDRGFTATIDGAPATIVHANVAFMTVRIPAGRHEVRLDYRPAGLTRGLWLSALGAALIVGAALALRNRT